MWLLFRNLSRRFPVKFPSGFFSKVKPHLLDINILQHICLFQSHFQFLYRQKLFKFCFIAHCKYTHRLLDQAFKNFVRKVGISPQKQ